MLTIYTIFGMMVGFEGYDNGKVYFGVYTPNCEYGYVITPEEIYLDTIYEKRKRLCLTMSIMTVYLEYNNNHLET